MSFRVHRFGLFELHTGLRQLHKQGRRVRLQEQPLRVLEVLLQKPGELVSREELRQQLWPSDVYVNFELGLNGAIKRLRLALGDSGDNPRFIETVPKCGYRFLVPVETVNDSRKREEQKGNELVENRVSAAPVTTSNRVVTDLGPATAAQPARSSATTPRWRSKPLWIVSALAATILAATYVARPQTPALHITRITRLSRSGRAWPREDLLSDGVRVYYTEFTVATSFQLRQILLNGNEDTSVTGLPANSLIRGLTPDQTTFAAISRSESDAGRLSPVWFVPVVGGPPRRLGNLQANAFEWSHDGLSMAIVRDNRLFLAAADGTGEHPLATVPGDAFYLRWSPDDRRLRFTVLGERGQLTIWEVSATGGDLHQLQFSWPGVPAEGWGDWTADGRYFIFVSKRQGVSNLWALEEQCDWLHRPRSEPMQLTAGPIAYTRPLPARNGPQLFALGTQPSGELVRFDFAQKAFVPFLGGLSADDLNFSRDGRWVTYVAYPEGTLWRARSDGSQQLQLTFPPMFVMIPRWSPDGKKILFEARRPGEFEKIYTISPDGGAPELLLAQSFAQTDPNWSPTGDSVIYNLHQSSETSESQGFYRIQLSTGSLQRIPSIDGLSRPLLSPDGRNLAAKSIEGAYVVVDLKTGKRTVLSRRKIDDRIWSADSQYIYFYTHHTLSPDKPALFRVRISDGQEEKVTDVLMPVTGIYGFWVGLTPDGSPLLLRDRDQTDVYALSLATR